MPVSKSKQGKPLGGIGAERQSGRKHSLILDDRLLSKQYITTKLDDRIDDTSYSSGWDGITDRAPSVNAVYDKINSLGSTGEWTHESTTLTDKVRSAHSGFYGIGSSMAFSDITERLTVDGNIRLKSTSDRLYLGSNTYMDANGGTVMFKNYDTTSFQMALRTSNSTDKIRLHFKPSGNDKGAIGLLGNEVLDIWNAHSHITFSNGNDTERMRINSTGLGIGTASPSYRLDVNGTSRFTGAVTMASNLTVAGNLTVTGTATSVVHDQVTAKDPFILINSDSTGADEDAGIEVERGDVLTNRKLFWDEGDDAWKIQTGDSTFTEIAGGGGTLTGTNTGDVTIVLASGVPTGAVTISSQAVTLGDKFVYNEGTGNAIGVDGGADGKLSCFAEEGDSGTTGLVVKGGNSASSNAAVSVTGHLEATTKSFNIPHPLLDNKRLVYGSLEGPEHGMYNRGSFDIEDGRRIVAIDLPVYWSAMVYDDYSINLTTYGDYNVWISNRDENGFWVETNAEKEWSFDWNVMGGRKDAKLVVEPDA